MKTMLAAAALALLAPPALAAELVMFEEPGCYYCLEWKKQVGRVYPKTLEGQRAPLRQVSMYEDRPEDLTFIKGVVYSPTFVLIDDGAEVGRIVGYPGEHFFWPLLGKMLAQLPDESAAEDAPSAAH